VDINMGCPVPKVVKTSGGSSLLRDPDRACRVSEAVVGAVAVPVTAKIRLGWDAGTRNFLEMATRLEATGIQGLAVHGRTRAQRYDPFADWAAITQVRAAVGIPVAGSGGPGCFASSSLGVCGASQAQPDSGRWSSRCAVRRMSLRSWSVRRRSIPGLTGRTPIPSTTVRPPAKRPDRLPERPGRGPQV